MSAKRNIFLAKPSGPYFYHLILFILQCFAWVAYFQQSSWNKLEISAFIDRQTFKPLPQCVLDVSTLDLLDTASVVEKLENADSNERQALMFKLLRGGLKFGGHSSPVHCKAPSKAAIIVPFRNRGLQLDAFLRYMHPFLQKQLLDYKIFVVEQTKGLPFNRGSLLNIGFVEALNHDPTIDCLILHDVDMLPEHERNDYSCPPDGRPRQLAWLIDIWNFDPVWRGYAGGVTAISAKDFMLVNGFSNRYWGWGGEDDDFYRRMMLQNLTFTRISDIDPSFAKYARYRTLFHEQAKMNKERVKIFNQTEGPENLVIDGLGSLRYERKIQLKPYYTHITAELYRDRTL